MDEENDNVTNMPQQPGVTRVQMLGVDAELIQDIRSALEELPHKRVKDIMVRITQCQVLNVDVRQGPPQGA